MRSPFLLPLMHKVQAKFNIGLQWVSSYLHCRQQVSYTGRRVLRPGRCKSRVARFVRWYNVEHRHRSLRYVNPAQRHDGHDQGILAARREVYEQAKARHPARCSGETRNWTPCAAVTLNPERDHVVSNALEVMHTQQKAA